MIKMSVPKGLAGATMALLLGLCLIGSAFAVGTSDGGTGDTPPVASTPAKPALPSIATAQAQIDGGHYDKAIAILKQIIAAKPNYADALNLMGFSLRKSGKMAEALKFYEKALKANPKHLGAHEYLGELYVETGKTAEAQKQLDILKGLCGETCEEYLDLKKAIGG